MKNIFKNKAILLIMLFAIMNCYPIFADELKITHPNGGEKYDFGDTTITVTWEGIREIDTVSIFFSQDNGKSWELISDEATNLSYRWEDIPIIDSDSCIMKIASHKPGAPDIEWQKCIGGSEFDMGYSIEHTLDGGYILAGAAVSSDGNIIGNHGGTDILVVKLDAVGEIEWQRCLGGSSGEQTHSIIQTLDGGYIIAGETSSI